GCHAPADRPVAELPAALARRRARAAVALLYIVGHDHARRLVVHPDQQLVRPDRPDADEYGNRPRAADALAERLERLQAEEHLGHREARTCRDLPMEAIRLETEIVRGRVHRNAGEERRRRGDRAAVEVLAAVEA